MCTSFSLHLDRILLLTITSEPRNGREADFCDYIGSEDCSSSDEESASLLRGGNVAAE